MPRFRDLEESFGTCFTEALCEETADRPSTHDIKEIIFNLDRERLLSEAESRDDTALLVLIEKEVGWRRLWDCCSDHGPKSIASLRAFIRTILYTAHATNCCPKCDIVNLGARTSLLSHMISVHTGTHFTSEEQRTLQLIFLFFFFVFF